MDSHSPSLYNSSPGRSAIDDPSSPYFLHHSDNPSIILVSQQLTGDNYASWSRSFAIALSAKNKMGFIDGSIQKPVSNDMNLINSWNRNNSVVISWILNSVSKEISASILYSESASAIWIDLQHRFQQSNGPRIFQLRRELINLNQDQLSVNAYYTKLKSLWEELNKFRPACTCGKCTCGGIGDLAHHHQDEYTISFLMGLNDSYAHVRGQILLMDPIPPVTKVFSLIIQEERQRTIGPKFNSTMETSNTMAFALRHDYANNANKFHKRERPYCTHCKYQGHTVDKCYKLHGYPPGYKQKQKSAVVNHVSTPSSFDNKNIQEKTEIADFFQHLDNNQCNQLMTLLSNRMTSTLKVSDHINDTPVTYSTGTCFSVSTKTIGSSSSVWLVDSGASKHICSNAKHFTNMRPIHNSAVTLPNQTSVPVYFAGDIKITPQLTLQNVLYIPQFRFNLLSVSSLATASKMIFTFHHDHFTIQENYTKRMIGRGKRLGDLYILDSEQSATKFNDSPSTANINHVDVQTWHSRLGHLSDQALIHMEDKLHCNVSKIHKNKPCYICPLAKQRRLPFVSHNNVSCAPFDLIHCDIWGPFNQVTHMGHQFFVTLVDDCTRFTWIFLLKHKSDVRVVVPRFFTMIHTQFDKRIKAFRSDNAKELAFTDFFHDQGVLHQFSCVDRPQQNSVVERKHQHLLNVARALYFQSKIPIKFWSECVLTATHLINRIPSPLLGNQSPYEKLYKKSPDYNSFRVFGCLAFASTLPNHRNKFQPRAKACVFIGYPMGMKAYKLYDLQSGQIFTSRDVVFHENIFPFHSTDCPDSIADPFPDLVLPTVNIDNLDHITSHSPNPQPISPPISDSLPSYTLVPMRRSTRLIKPPSYLREYHCNLLSHISTHTTLSPYPLSQVISYQQLSPYHRNFVLNVSSTYEPQYYHQAVHFPEWRQAMQLELAALELNNTWSLVPLPKDKHTIGCRWIYKVKYKSDGSIDRHKARLVAKGYTQQEGVDFLETFSPVAKLVTVKIILALAATQHWHIHQLDINNAFLHGDLFEEVYMDLPLGYSRQGEPTDSSIRHVCKLNKSIYGLKQASRQWYSKFSSSLLTLGFTQSKSDYSLFTKGTASNFVALLVYVDDIIITSPSPTVISSLTTLLNSQFKLKDLGNLKYFFGHRDC